VNQILSFLFLERRTSMGCEGIICSVFKVTGE
jgi:hypothetical protein